MKKWIFVFIVWAIFRSGPSFAQITYSWPSQNISLDSRVELQIEERSNEFHLEGSGIVIDFAAVGGMEGISGLAPLLDSYAESFGYTVNGKSRGIPDFHELAAARIDGRRDGKSLVLFLLATRDYKKHFTCEILFPESQRRNVEAMVKGISYGTGAAKSETTGREEGNQDPSSENREQENRPDAEQVKEENRSEPMHADRHQETNTLPDNGPVANTHLTGTPVEKLVWQLLSAYSPDGYYPQNRIWDRSSMAFMACWMNGMPTIMASGPVLI